ncbi:hypothetical protein KCTC52924_03218 [Arenibacter antarcticus]|uniref:Lipoprotein n=1 Tax=Arenibacter antarcticus TaxID=2040469 RepID=A0ABW5VJ11_9FLAO|nr:hypothetical protein [Arenibacter sp. H213]
MKKYSVLLLGFGMLLLSGCSNDALNDYSKSLTSQEVQVQMEANSATEGLDEMLSQLLITNKVGSTNKTNTDCAALSFVGKSISVVYNQCVVDGNTVNGTLTLTAKEGNTEGTTGSFEISFNSFAYNNYVLEGTKSMVFDFSQANKLVFTIDTNMKFVDANDLVTTHKGSKIYTWNIDNFNTEGADVSCSGAWDIVRNATTYKFKIDTPLTGKIGCAYITTGVLALEVEGLSASLDFGDGDCDQKGTVNYPNGKSEEISW